MMLSTYFRRESEARGGGTCPEGGLSPPRGAMMPLVPRSVAAAPTIPQISPKPVSQQMRNKVLGNPKTLSPLGLAEVRTMPRDRERMGVVGIFNHQGRQGAVWCFSEDSLR